MVPVAPHRSLGALPLNTPNPASLLRPLLSAALLKGCGFDLLVTDRDLDPIRDCPEFKALVPAARALSSRPPATTQR